MSETYREYLRCDFNDAELSTFGKELARANKKMSTLEDEKKRVVSQFKADMDSVQADINRVMDNINSGFEMRNVDCRVELDTPEPGKKRIVRVDTGEEVKVQPMTDMDRQMRLELQNAAEKAEAGKTNGVIITPPPPPPLAIAAPQAEVEVLPPDDAAPLAPAVAMGGTHQKGTRQRRGARNPEAEGIADGSGLDPADETE